MTKFVKVSITLGIISNSFHFFAWDMYFIFFRNVEIVRMWPLEVTLEEIAGTLTGNKAVRDI